MLNKSFRLFILMAFVCVGFGQSVLPGSNAVSAQSSFNYVFRRTFGDEGLVLTPTAVAVSDDGLIFALSRTSGRVTIISPENYILKVWGGIGSGTDQFANPTSIAVDPRGNVYISDTQYLDTGGSYGRVFRFTWDGQLINQWGISISGEFSTADDIAIDNGGIVYVADLSNSRIQKYLLNGQYEGQINIRASSIAVDNLGNIYTVLEKVLTKYTIYAGFIAQWGVSGDQVRMDTNGNVYIPDNIQGINCDVQKFSPTGALLSTWQCNDENGLAKASSITIDLSGSVFVADEVNNQVVKLSSSGKYLTHFGLGGKDSQIVSSQTIMANNEKNGTVYLVSPATLNVKEYSRLGKQVNAWLLETGSSPGSAAVDPSGNLFVTNRASNQVIKYSPTGAILKRIGKGGDGNIQFTSLFNIATDRQGNLYAGDYTCCISKITGDGFLISQFSDVGYEKLRVDGNGNVFGLNVNREFIWKRSMKGTLLASWGTEGHGEGQFFHPMDIALDKAGNVFVADTYNHRIQVYSNNGIFLTQFGSYGFENGQFNVPSDLVVFDNGDLLVKEDGNSRIQVFGLGNLAADPISGRVQNGSFEGGLSDWLNGGSLPSEVTLNVATGGSHSLLLGSKVPQEVQGDGQAWVNQTVYLDPAIPHPTLSFWYNLVVNDILDYSDFMVEIQDGVGLSHLSTVVRDGYKPPSPIAPVPGTQLGWHAVKYDLAPYRGKNIRLVFKVRNLHPESLGIWGYLDDVRVVDASKLNGLTNYLPLVLR